MINRRAFIALSTSLPLLGLYKNISATPLPDPAEQLAKASLDTAINASESQLGIYGWHAPQEDTSEKILIRLSSSWKGDWL
jgi:hypothetical protein